MSAYGEPWGPSHGQLNLKTIKAPELLFSYSHVNKIQPQSAAENSFPIFRKGAGIPARGSQSSLVRLLGFDACQKEERVWLGSRLERSFNGLDIG